MLDMQKQDDILRVSDLTVEQRGTRRPPHAEKPSGSGQHAQKTRRAQSPRAASRQVPAKQSTRWNNLKEGQSIQLQLRPPMELLGVSFIKNQRVSSTVNM